MCKARLEAKPWMLSLTAVLSFWYKTPCWPETTRWTGLTGQWTPGTLLSSPSWHWDYKCKPLCLALFVGTRSWTRVLMLANQTLYWPSPVPRPQNRAFKASNCSRLCTVLHCICRTPSGRLVISLAVQTIKPELDAAGQPRSSQEELMYITFPLLCCRGSMES